MRCTPTIAFCGCLGLLAALASVARAWDGVPAARPPAPIQSLELKVAYASAIVRGVVVAREPATIEGESFATLRIWVDESLKGPVRGGQWITVLTRNTPSEDWHAEPAPAAAGVPGRRPYLFFLVTGAEVSDRAPTPAQKLAWAAAAWALPDYAYNGPIPLFGALPPVVSYLNGPRTLLDTPDAVLAAVRREVASAPAARQGPPLTLLVNPAAAGDESLLPLLPGAFATLDIVVDARTERQALAWTKSAEPMDRWLATGVLARFQPSPPAIDALRDLCRDPFVEPPRGWPIAGMVDDEPPVGPKWRGDRYPIRVAAWELLKRWHVDERDVALYRPAHATRFITPKSRLTLLLLIVAAVFSLPILRRRVDARRLRPRLVAGPAGVSLLLLAATLAAWVAGRWWIGEVSTPAGGTDGRRRVEVSVVGRYIQVLRADQFPLPTPAGLTLARSTDETRRLWLQPGAAAAAPQPQATTTWQAAGVTVADANAAGSATAPAVPCRIVRTPLWVLAAPLAVLPALRLLALRRYRRRLRTGHCIRCGYDLRESPARCPECGHVDRTRSALGPAKGGLAKVSGTKERR